MLRVRTSSKVSLERWYADLQNGYGFCYVFLNAWMWNIEKQVVRFFFGHSKQEYIFLRFHSTFFRNFVLNYCMFCIVYSFLFKSSVLFTYRKANFCIKCAFGEAWREKIMLGYAMIHSFEQSVSFTKIFFTPFQVWNKTIL